MIVFQTIEIVVTFLELLMGILINAQVLGNEEDRLKESAFASFIISIIVWNINRYQLFSIMATGIGLIGIIAATCMIHKVKIWDAVVLTAAYILLIYIVDFLTITTLGIVFRDAQFAEHVTASFSMMRLYFLLISKALLVLVYNICAKGLLIKVRVSVRKIWMGVVLCTAIVGYFVKNTFLQVNYDAFFLWFLLFLLVLVGIYLGIQCVSYTHEKDCMLRATERNLMMADSYEKMIENYQKRQITYHDLKNQYLIIEEYLKRKEYVKAAEYVEKLEAVSYQDMVIRTGINVLDILLECKMKEVEAQGIHMEIISDMIQLDLTEQETIALMGNALDNAIDACKKITSERRWIQVVIRGVKAMTFIKISNSYEELPKKEDGRFLSSKRGNQIHGLGMTSMEVIVDKYDGTIGTEYGDKQFSIIISFFH